MVSKFIHLAVAILAFAIGVALASVWLPKFSTLDVKDYQLRLELSNESRVVTIRGGSSFGMCMKDCNEEVRIENTEVQLIVSSNDKARFADKQFEGKITEQGWKSILQLIDSNVLMALPDVVGCPDCADGGAAWVEVTFSNGASKKVTYEFRYPPKQIKQLTEKLTAIRTPYIKGLR